MERLVLLLKQNRLGFSIALIVIFLMQGCNKRLKDELSIQKNNVTALEKEKALYRIKNGQLVTSVTYLEYDKKQLKELVLEKDKTLKEISRQFSNVKTVTKEITTTNIDAINIAYKDSAPCIYERVGEIENKWYSMYYKSNQHGLEIKELVLPDTVKIVTGTKRKWLFGKETQTLDITHSNIYINTEEVQHIEIPKNKSFIERYWIKEIGAFALGFFIAK